MDLTRQQQRLLLDAAREVIRRALRDELLADDPPLPDPTDPTDHILLKPAGCFVSLHDLTSRRLRGCVGRLDAKHPIWHAVQLTAASVLHDPRFSLDPVRLEELAALEIEITILSALRDCDHVLDFEPLRDGIYLTIGENSGCFLPQVARDTGWTREQLLDRLCAEKLGLNPASWRSIASVKLQRFTTLIIGPEPFEGAVIAVGGNEFPAC
jgi:AmmeMemoRadiSam system protein A